MRTGFSKIILLLSILLLSSGCFLKNQGSNKQFGSIQITIQVPPDQDQSDYPQWPPGRTVKVIPAGTKYFDIAVYNQATGWVKSVTISLDNPNVTTASATIDMIPAGSGYTVEVLPYETQAQSPIVLACGRTEEVTVSPGGTSPVTVTLNGINYIALDGFPETVYWGQIFSVIGLAFYPPVSFTSEQNELWLVPQDSAGDPIILTGPGTYFDASQNFTQFTVGGSQDRVFYPATKVTGTYKIAGFIFKYKQPLTQKTYSIFYNYSEGYPIPTMTITEPPPATGSLEVIIE